MNDDTDFVQEELFFVDSLKQRIKDRQEGKIPASSQCDENDFEDLQEDIYFHVCMIKYAYDALVNEDIGFTEEQAMQIITSGIMNESLTTQ
jgi:hypothetical protein